MSEEKNDVSYKALMDKGQVLFDTKEYKEAIKVYKLIQVMYGETLDEVSLASLYIRFANAYYCLEDRDKSTYYYEEYLKIYPQGQLSVFSRLAHAYYYLDADKCVDYHNKSLNFETTKYDTTSKLFSMLKSSFYDQSDIKNESERELEIVRNTFYKNVKPYDYTERKKQKDKKLKIGYLSSDCYTHTMMNYIVPIWENHNQEEFDFVIFNGAEKEDFTTERIKKTGIKMVPCAKLSEAEIAKLIHSEEIDILIDLGGYTHFKSLVAFYKPAPILVSYLGYLNTLGIPEFDYILTDRYTIPEKYADLYTEKPLYLDKGYQIFAEKNYPEVDEPPYKTNGYITYGCFNCTSKYSDAILFVWAQLLKKDTTAKLLLYRTQMTRSVIRLVKEKFAKYGIKADRLIFDTKSLSPHYKAYLKADIALDPYPFSGMSIAIEAAAMGLPTISLVGEGMQSRGAGRINALLGLEELNASNGEEYIKNALALANDKEKISMLRQTLRTKLLNSDIRVNEKEFTQDLESKFKKAWQDFTNSP